MNKRELDRFKKMLLAQREEIMGNARRALSGDIHVDPDDFPDEMDTASSEVNLQFTGRLREREQGLLSKIEAALEKIERGEYGSCVNCGEEIGLRGRKPDERIRTPLPWDGTAPGYGFTTGTPWQDVAEGVETANLAA